MDELKNLIANYKPENEVIELVNNLNLLVIAGISGSGKDTTTNLLLESHPEKYQKLLADTTRSPRQDESGDYNFIDLETALQKIHQKQYLQVELVHSQQISGISKQALESQEINNITLASLTIQSAIKLKAMGLENVQLIFLVPPDIEVFQHRLNFHRDLAPDELDRRKNSALSELKLYLETDSFYGILSDYPTRIAQVVDHFMTVKFMDASENIQAREAARKILIDLQSL
jgi:guanylate kinase